MDQYFSIRPTIKDLITNISRLDVFQILYLLTQPNLFYTQYPVIEKVEIINDNHREFVQKSQNNWETILNILLQSPVVIDYEFVCGISDGFAKRYSPEIIRQLLRKYNIQGYNFAVELSEQNFETKEHYLIINLFFKGKI